MMHDNDKTCFVFRTACLCPNSCETNDDRQMRMTDKDTPHRFSLRVLTNFLVLLEVNQPTSNLEVCFLAKGASKPC